MSKILTQPGIRRDKQAKGNHPYPTKATIMGHVEPLP